MMNDRRRKRQILKVDHYDGQCIYSGHELFYELGGYLGGGAAGVVYEAFCARTKRHVAIKILNPVGYKLLPSTLLSRCIVAVQGKPLEFVNESLLDEDDDHNDFPMAHMHARGYQRRMGSTATVTTTSTSSSATTTAKMKIENVWWLIHPTTKQAVAAYEDPRTGTLRELSLPHCIDVWGADLQVDDVHDAMADKKYAQLEAAVQEIQVKNQILTIPKIPKKFIKFANTRRTIHREIANMSGLEYHENVLRLDEALELVQDSKCTTFLVLELAAGGELFDRIKLDCGTDEETARRYFRQLISGVAFCHSSGVCHRDLKPENLLLADNEEFSTLKIADFGLSAIFAMTENDATTPEGSSSVNVQAQVIRRLRSVVGSPHYVAPEVLMDMGQGYDGAKADAWSIGVIVYAMLAGNLPFGKDLLKCLRYEKFKKWCYNTKYSDEDDPIDESVAFPSWFFPAQFSLEVKSLITQLLYPDPSMRLAVEEAQRHPWVLGQKLRRVTIDNDPQASPASLSSPVPVNSPINRCAVIVNVPQSVIDQEQQRHTPSSSSSSSSLFTAASPSAISRLHRGRSPRQAPSPLSLCPPSPQKHLLGHSMMSRYMPSVDETAPLSGGQTPPSSPKAAVRDACDELTVDTRPRSTSLQFEMDTDDLPKGNSGSSNAMISGAHMAQHPTTAADMPMQHPTSAAGSSRPPRRFTSPPLATGTRSSLLHRRHQLRRNSPPELYLSRFGKGIKFEAIHNDVDCGQFDMSITLSSTPTESSMLETIPSVTSSTDPSKSDPPSYHDVVSRSTRFITALPASLVLGKIETILTRHPIPPPYPATNETQRVAIDWDSYQLDVWYGDVLTCTVQVFLFQRGVYLVEFRRGQVEIFQFKRFYEDMRQKLSESMDLSASHAHVARTPQHRFGQGKDDDDLLLSPRQFPRKRNKSMGVQDDFHA